MSTRLLTEPRLADPDGFYDRLVSLYRERDDEGGRLLDARLILLLANHIGDATVLDEAVVIAAQLPVPSDADRPPATDPAEVQEAQ